MDRGPQENGLYNDDVGFVAPRHRNTARIRLTDAGGNPPTSEQSEAGASAPLF